jgi:hypothetical protein
MGAFSGGISNCNITEEAVFKCPNREHFSLLLCVTVGGTRDPFQEVPFAMLQKLCRIRPSGPDLKSLILPELRLSSLTTEDIRVTSIQHSHRRATEEFTAGGTKFNLWEEK